MAENKVRFLRGTAAEYAGAVKDDDTFYYTTDDEKFYVGNKEITGGGITVDSNLSDTSTNPVQNKVIKAAIDEKADRAVATTTADGLMSAADKTKLDGADDTYALKSKYGDTTIDVGRKSGTTVGRYSTAEGYYTTASGNYSHAEGASTTASGNISHTEGYLCTASSDNSHAEGNNTTASGAHSHSEGDSTIASGIGSHAGGASSIASSDYSFAHGIHVESNNSCEVSLGKFNKSSSDTLFSIGDGKGDTARHNAFEITKTGGKLHDKDIATTDLIPTELPANGGNADTVDGKHANDFIYPRAMLSNVDLNTILYPCSALIYGDCINMPPVNSWGTLLCYSGGTGSHVQLWVTAADSSMFKRHYDGARWSEWKEISTTPIKSEVTSTTTDSSGNAIIYASSENKKIISINCFSKQAVPFTYNDDQYGHFYENDGTPYVGSVSFCVYYIEG